MCIRDSTCAVRGHAEMRVLGNVGALVHAKARDPRLIVAVLSLIHI